MAKSPLLVTRYWSWRKNSSFSKMKLICEHSCTMDRFNLPEMWAKRKAERKLCLVKFLGQRNFTIQTFRSAFRFDHISGQFKVSNGPPVGSVAWTLPFPFRERASRGSITLRIELQPCGILTASDWLKAAQHKCTSLQFDRPCGRPFTGEYLKCLIS